MSALREKIERFIVNGEGAWKPNDTVDKWLTKAVYASNSIEKEMLPDNFIDDILKTEGTPEELPALAAYAMLVSIHSFDCVPILLDAYETGIMDDHVLDLVDEMKRSLK